MIVVLLLMVGLAGVVQATLTRTVAEQKKVNHRLLARQLQAEAEGQLAFAQNMVNAASYVDGWNQALTDAVQATDSKFAGCEVFIEQVASSDYFTLSAEVVRNGVTKTAQSIVREAFPASAYNLFVIDHPVGISGQPRGDIHCNKSIDFFFPGSQFRESVTAVEGFNFVAGATEENTAFLQSANAAAEASDLLDGVDFGSLSAEADLLQTDSGYIAEVELKGNYGEVKLYEPAYTTTETRTRIVQELVRYDSVPVIETVPVYEDVEFTYEEEIYVPVEYTEIKKKKIYERITVPAIKKVPIYENQLVEYPVQVPQYATRTVTKDVEKQVWVPFSEMTAGERASGGTVGSTGDLTGLWRTVTEQVDYEEEYITGYVTETRTRTERVKVGVDIQHTTKKKKVWTGKWKDKKVKKTRQEFSHTETRTGVRQDLVGYEDVTRMVEQPVYKDVEETYEVEVEIADKLIKTERFDMNGTVYIGGDVRKLSGKVEGRLSLLANGSVRLTGSLQYVDEDGNTRMLNGTNNQEQYKDNPDYDGSSVLAVMAKEDVLYADDGPASLEINATLVSAEGSVGYEGLMISEDGSNISLQDGSAAKVKESLRRLGGVVCAKRPVATFIDSNGRIAAGFKTGHSLMDQRLMLGSGENVTPPFMFESQSPTWVMSTSGYKFGTIE